MIVTGHMLMPILCVSSRCVSFCDQNHCSKTFLKSVLHETSHDSKPTDFQVSVQMPKDRCQLELTDISNRVPRHSYRAVT